MNAILNAVFCSLALGALAQQSDLGNLLSRGDARRQEYVEAFKNLIAVETRLTEIIDRNGRVEKERVVVSDFLVYRSGLRDDLVSEYRIARAVDGRPVRTSTEDAIRQFQKLAGSKTLAQESDRLKQANLKHGLRYFMWGATLHPLRMLEWQERLGVEFAIAGREGVAGRDAIALDYRLKELRAIRAEGIYRHFDAPARPCAGAHGSIRRMVGFSVGNTRSRCPIATSRRRSPSCGMNTSTSPVLSGCGRRSASSSRSSTRSAKRTPLPRCASPAG